MDQETTTSSTSTTTTTTQAQNDEEAKYGRLKKKKGHRLSQIKGSRVKSSSTSTMFISSSISSPDVDELLLCIAATINRKIINGTCITRTQQSYEIFDERLHPLTNEKVDLTKTPDQTTLYRFIESIFDAEQLSHECGIMMLAYIDRIQEKANVVLLPHNWRRILLSTLILASKVWEDQAVWNVDFLSVFPCVTVKDLGQLEKVLLRLLQYNVSLQASVYAKYYFELRALAERNERNFPVKPLSKESERKLEQRSMAEEEKALSERPGSSKRSKSLDWDSDKSAPVVLN